jgi:hypothetical protein
MKDRFYLRTVFGIIILTLFCWGLNVDTSPALDIFPNVSGNGEEDSITLTFETFDTTAIPLLSTPDSLKILRFGPSGDLIDSLGEDDSAVTQIRTGSYVVELQSTDSISGTGRYVVRIYAFMGGEIRGAISGGYYVREGSWDDLDTILDLTRTTLDTLNDGFASQINQSNLDTTMSSRSTLTVTDNIGIDWMNISNATAMQLFPNTFIEGILSKVQVDSAKLARSVWDNDIVEQSSRSVDLSSCQAGSGAYPCSLYVYNSADSSAIQGILIRFMNDSETATEALGITDPNGMVVASLDAAQYKIWPYKAGVDFEALPDSLTVSSPASVDTIWGSGFDPGAPAGAQLCRTFGWVYDLSGIGISGVTVTAGITQTPIRYQGTVISPYLKSTTTDSIGYWYLDLLPNESLTPSDSEYEIMIYYESGRIARKRIRLPDLSNWELNW